MPGLIALMRMPFGPNAAARPDGREHQRGVGGAARQVHRIRDLAAAADDVDDDAASARRHPLQRGVERMDVAEVLGVHRGMPRAGVEIDRRVSAGGAGGIHEDVDRPDVALDFGDHPLRVVGADEVGGDRGRRVAGRGKLRERRIEVLGAARHEHDARALARERIAQA